MRSSLRFGAISAVLGAAASSALASTVTLSNESSTGGLDLNSANVLLAASAVDSSTLSPSNLTVQGVTFTPMSYSISTSIATASGSGITITTSEVVAYSHYSTYTFQYAKATVDATTLTSGSSATLGFNALQPGDALQSLLSGGVQYSVSSSFNPMTITISGLQSGNQYVIDLLTSCLGTEQRSQTVTFNGGTVLNPSSTPSASDGGTAGYYLYSANGYGNSFGYDTNDTVTAVGGEITISLDALSTGIPFFNDIVVSSVVPEPASLGLIGMGVCGLVLRRRRRAQSPL